MSASRTIRKAADLVSEITQANVYIIWYDRENDCWSAMTQNVPGFLGSGKSPEQAMQDLRTVLKSGAKND